MSGYDAYLSFANYMKDKLASSGIAVSFEKKDVLEPPYLRFQLGPDEIKSGWLSSQMIQAWLVVKEINTEPIEVTYGKALNIVLDAGRDVGHIPKKDYAQNPTVQRGTVIPRIFSVSADMSNDAKLEKHVLTWVLNSGA